jgi:hypothetical protein
VKQLVIALACALLVCLVVIAFLLGRMSAPAPAAVVVEEPPLPTRIERGTEPVQVERTIVQRPSEAPPPPETPARASSVDQYFDRIKRFQVLAGSDPNAYAYQLAEASMKGDTSGFDELLAGLETARREAQSMTPPPACAGYHREMLVMLAESSTMLRAMRDAIASRNLEELAAIAGKAQSMQSRVDALEAMEKQIRSGR